MLHQRRAVQVTTTHSRPRPIFSESAPLEQLTLHVKPIVKERLLRIAEREGLSLSSAGAAYLEKSLQQEVDMGYGALVNPVFESIIDKRLAKLDSRLA